MQKTTIAWHLAGALFLAGCAASKPAPLPAPTVETASGESKGSGFDEATVTVTATVEAIDTKTRSVTLRGPDGNLTTIQAGDQVKNLAQVKKGDLVTAVFYESIAYEVKKKGTATPGIVEATDATTAPVGQKPAGVGASAVTVTATITKIDTKANTVTLKGPEGKEVTVKVKNPDNLKGVKVGDLVEITYSVAVGISVEKAPKS